MSDVKRRLWICSDCRGVFGYPADTTPNFCPYCRGAMMPLPEQEVQQ